MLEFNVHIHNESDIELAQSELKQNAEKLSDNGYAPPDTRPIGGEFSAIHPVSETLAVKWHKQTDTSGDLAREVALLKHLNDHNISAIRTYGNVFQIKNRDAVLMEWLPEARLLDVKFPDKAPLMLIGALLNVQIPAGEAWAMRYPSIRAEIEKKLKDQNFDLEGFQQRARNFANSFHTLSTQLSENGILVGDLQILITAGGEVRIIDPQDVLILRAGIKYATLPSHVTAIEPNAAAGALQRSNINADYLRIINQGTQMILNLEKVANHMSGLDRGPLAQYVTDAIKPGAPTLAQSTGIRPRNTAQMLLNRSRQGGSKIQPSRNPIANTSFPENTTPPSSPKNKPGK